jgi:hypothetical protein
MNDTLSESMRNFKADRLFLLRQLAATNRENGRKAFSKITPRS